MAEVVVSPLLQVIFDKLASSALTKLGFSKDLERLKQTLPIIQAVIEDAEERQLKDKKVKIWLTRLKDVAYDADDLLDELATHDLRRSMKNEKKVWMTYLSFEPFMNFFTISRKLKQIRERLDDIVRDISNFQFTKVVAYERTDTRIKRETGPDDEDETEVCGRREEANGIVDLLLTSGNMSNPVDVSVIPIVGIGGIGKTTLARLAYNDERVERHFDLRMWVSVYDHFNVRKITTEILDYVAKHKCEYSQIGVLQSQLRESLSGKRFLLVLDDVWNEDREEWDKLRNPLRGGSNGSKIVVTTRSLKVASIMSMTSPYVLEALVDDDCWTLFKQRAFAKGEEEDHPNLLPIGEKIVKKCKGVPLAAKILGSLMLFKREESEWSHVEGSELWNLDEGENRILSVLRLSYNHLPSHLKRCFTHCAVFPKNYEINREKLINRWVAEGLIQSSDDLQSGKMMEDTGNEYFNDLLLMCFFQGVSNCPSGTATKFKMHDIIHDLAQSIAGNELLIIENEGAEKNLKASRHSSVLQGNLAQTRHASVICNFKSTLIPETLYEAKKLRTLNLLSPKDDSGKALRTAFRVFKHLRVLDLSGSGIQRLHKSIGGLTYSRYLDLSDSPIETLPENIGDLCNLQTLNLSGCRDLMELPHGLINLVNLRHLNIKDCVRLTHLPADIFSVRSLQTLPIVVFEPHYTPSYRQSLLEFRRLNLRGELKIKHLENIPIDVIGYFSRYKRNLLSHMKLQSLGLSWREDNEGKLERCSSRPAAERPNAFCHEEKLLRRLQPNGILRRLSITGYSGINFPDWLNGVALPNLTEVVLINCRRCEVLPTLGQLPFLKVLIMQGMDAVVDIGRRFYGIGGDKGLFPSLKELTLRDFPSLRSWKSKYLKEAFTCLERLSIINCRRCEVLPTLGQLPFLKVLIMQGMDAVVEIDSRFYGKGGDKRLFPSLKELTLRDFPSLRSWESIDLKEAFTCLERLSIITCPGLIMMPWFPILQHLELRNCNDMILRSAADLTSLSTLVIDIFPELFFIPKALLPNKTLLTSLTISSCPRLGSLPMSLGNLPGLKSLTIRWCEELDTLPHGMRNLTSLETLEISECPRLVSFPKEGIEGLSSLRSFSIENCANLTCLPMGMKHLRALEHLTIMYCPRLAYLPDGLRQLSSLRSLTLLSCPELTSLPEGLQHIKNLQNLEIRSCPNLKNLPERIENLISLRTLAISDCENIKSLPEGLQHLSALQHLSIRDCPELEARCKKGRGEDWHKISHIPYIYIGSPALPQGQDIASSSSNALVSVR